MPAPARLATSLERGAPAGRDELVDVEGLAHECDRAELAHVRLDLLLPTQQYDGDVREAGTPKRGEDLAAGLVTEQEIEQQQTRPVPRDGLERRVLIRGEWLEALGREDL